MADPDLTHRALRRSLANHVRSMAPRWIAVEELTLGSSAHLNGDPAQRRLAWDEKQTGRADVWALRVSWSSPCARIYEVKATRGDLLADLRSEKWRAYLPYCNQLIWAMPEGIARTSELPADTGVVVYTPTGWRAHRYGPDRGLERPVPALMAAMFAAYRDGRAGEIGECQICHGPRWSDGPVIETPSGDCRVCHDCIDSFTGGRA
jgi:hypothetical protein